MLETIASIATAGGVVVAAWQLWKSRLQANTTFEDEFTREYREIVKGIPMAALVGQEVADEDYSNIRELVYNYIDLSNEQTFLRQLGRVRTNAWHYWREGMETNLKALSLPRSGRTSRRMRRGASKSCAASNPSGSSQTPGNGRSARANSLRKLVC